MSWKWLGSAGATVLLALAGCDSSTGPRPAPPPARMAAVGDTAFVENVGSTYRGWLMVQVLDASYVPVPGAPVTWTVVSGGGTLTPVAGETDAEGAARAYFTLGLRLDVNHVVEARVGSLEPVRFTFTPRYPWSTAENFTRIGHLQEGTVGEPLPQPVGVRLTLPDGRPLIGAEVRFATQDGSAQPGTVRTDSTGTALTSWTLGGSPGDQSINWSAVSSGHFILATARPGPPAEVAPLGTVQNYTPKGQGRTVGVLVRDAFGNPLEGVEVRWAVETGSGSVAPTSTTGADGRTTVLWTVGTGEDELQQVSATVDGFAPLTWSTRTKDFFFNLYSPPSPGPGAVLSDTTLRVEAESHPYTATTSHGRITSFTLTVADRSTNFSVRAGPTRWAAILSLAGLPAGEHTYHVRMEDYEGRVHEESVTFTYQP